MNICENGNVIIKCISLLCFETPNGWRKWDDSTGDYTKEFPHFVGVQVPFESDVEVYTIMVQISTVSPTKPTTMIYDPIGPYVSDRARTFDVTNGQDRFDARAMQFCDHNGCDYTLRVTQGGATTTYMLYAAGPVTVNNVNAISVPTSLGEITKIELLSTPDAALGWPTRITETIAVWPNNNLDEDCILESFQHLRKFF